MSPEKRQIINDADILMMYGADNVDFPPYAIVEVCMDDSRFEKAARMFLRGNDSIEQKHYDRVLEELDLNLGAGNIDKRSYLFTKVRMYQLLHRGDAKATKKAKIRHLKMRLKYYEEIENFETCAGIKAILEGMGVNPTVNKGQANG